MWRAAGLQMWINWCLYCQVVVPVISSRPRTIFIFLISSQSTDYRFHFIISLRPAIVCWSPHLLRAGPGLWNVIWEGNGSDWQCIDWLGGWGVGWGWGRTKNGSKCFLWFGIQQAACTSACTLPSHHRWFLIPFNWARWRWTAGRGATGWDNPAQPAAATRHTLKFRPSISIGLPICNAD